MKQNNCSNVVMSAALFHKMVVLLCVCRVKRITQSIPSYRIGSFPGPFPEVVLSFQPAVGRGELNRAAHRDRPPCRHSWTRIELDLPYRFHSVLWIRVVIRGITWTTPESGQEGSRVWYVGRGVSLFPCLWIRCYSVRIFQVFCVRYGCGLGAPASFRLPSA